MGAYSIFIRKENSNIQKVMKILFISDTHSLHWSVPELPEADVFVHCGDFMNTGRKKEEIESFNDWLGSLKIPKERKLICAGNHDIWFDETHRESSPRRAEISRNMLYNATYLQDQSIEIEGVKFYLSPWTPAFLGWGFNLPIGEHEKYWEKIPEDTDVLVTHGPPYEILDSPYRREDFDGWESQYILPPTKRCGCIWLRDKVKEVKPKIHAFGHIHGGRGVRTTDDTTFLNVAFLNEQYNPGMNAGYTLVEIIDGKVRVLEQ